MLHFAKPRVSAFKRFGGAKTLEGADLACPRSVATGVPAARSGAPWGGAALDAVVHPVLDAGHAVRRGLRLFAPQSGAALWRIQAFRHLGETLPEGELSSPED